MKSTKPNLFPISPEPHPVLLQVLHGTDVVDLVVVSQQSQTVSPSLREVSVVSLVLVIVLQVFLVVLVFLLLLEVLVILVILVILVV